MIVLPLSEGDTNGIINQNAVQYDLEAINNDVRPLSSLFDKNYETDYHRSNYSICDGELGSGVAGLCHL